MSDLISKLSTASVIMGNLPENPGYNGSILLIDDTEAENIVNILNAASVELKKLYSEIQELSIKLENSEQRYFDNT